MDMNLSKRDSLPVQGDVYRGQGGQQAGLASLFPPFLEVVNDQTRSAGGNVLGRWKHSSAGSETALQLYYDRTFRRDALMGEVLNTFDLDFQHRRALGSRHDLLWGCGYRLGRDELQNSFSLSFDPRHRQDHLLSAFLEDDIELLEDRLRLTLGSKFEHNSFTGYEVQPNLRLIWTPHLRHAGARWEDAMLHGDNPGHQVGLRSSWDLSRTVQFDSELYYVGALASLGVPAYTRVDAHLGWHPARPVALSLALSNLLDPRHPEYIPEDRDWMAEIGRSIHGKITWRF
jgi:outer membrane receptor protein involved in Fe transport